MLSGRNMSLIICIMGALQQMAPAAAADVTVKLSGQENETASVFLESGAMRWAATNGSKGDLFKARSGEYKSGTNVVPGFAVKGTGLLVGGGGDAEAFLYDLIPGRASPGDEGRAQFLGTGKVGRWTVR